MTSSLDILYVNIDWKYEVDFDDKEDISNIENILADDDHFYVLANKKEGRLGYYLLQIEVESPDTEAVYLINWNNKLDIGNCDIQVMHETLKCGEKQEYIVVSYKCIGINTFNVFVIDLGTRLIKYWHEGYQLWESPVKGFLLSTNDFLILSKDGINVLSLGEKEGRVIKDQDGQRRYIHALGTCNYLKIEPTNHLLFACQFYDDRQICIQDQYNDASGQTHFDDIFKIKVHEITLRELLVLQSIYAANTQSDIELLVKEQPDPTIFFKVFLELGIKSMIPYLAFDSRSIRTLLSEENEKHFSADFPVFYKNQDGTSAIDVCLGNNQIRSVNLMINYIIKFQNSFAYAHLFQHNIVDLLNKGVQMTPLFKSKIFINVFDYDEWPGTHHNTNKMLAPYNNSVFKLRYEYPCVYKRLYRLEKKEEAKVAKLKEKDPNYVSGVKVYKIRYQANLLTSMSQDEGSIMDAIADSEELGIFKTELIKDMVDYKWQTYAQSQHTLGAFIHWVYVAVLMSYINVVFLKPESFDAQGVRINPDPYTPLLFASLVCLCYPIMYDGTQMLKQGFDYFKDGWNYIDILNIGLGLWSVYCQLYRGTLELDSKLVMIALLLICLLKTFFYMRVVMSFSYIVTMIINVFIDLRVFLLFFTVLIMMFSAVFDVISRNDASEYKYISPFAGNMLTTLRLALGDFDFGVLEGDKLNPKQHILFWAIWILMVLFSSLVFLNFIIAEVSNSYQSVKESIDALIYKERAALIREVETITPTSTKKNDKIKFPKYIIIREMEE